MKKRNVEVAGKIGQSEQLLPRNSSASCTSNMDPNADQIPPRVQFGRRSDSSTDQVDMAKQARARAYQDAIKEQMEEKQRRVEQEKARVKAEDLALEKKITELSKVKSDADIGKEKRSQPAFLDEAICSGTSEVNVTHSAKQEHHQLSTLPSFLQDSTGVAPHPQGDPAESPSCPNISETSPASWLRQPSFLPRDTSQPPNGHAPYQQAPVAFNEPPSSYPSYSYYASAQYQPASIPPIFHHGQNQLPHTQHEVVHKPEMEDDDVELDCETALVML